VAGLHLDEVPLELWEEIDDPAGGDAEVVRLCAVEIHGLVTVLAPRL
jgi:hypothetical protein